MQITETNTDGLKREFKIVIPAAQIEQRINTRLLELGQRVRLPGFRPGKVPMPLLRQRYQQSVMGEVVEDAVHQGSHQVLTERNLRPAGQPKIEITKFEDGSDLEFSMAMELVPEIKFMDFKTVKLEKLSVDVEDGEIDENLRRLAERQRKSEPVSEQRGATTGDIVVIDFVGRVDGAEFAGGSAKGQHLEIGSGTFIPGFEDQLLGVKAGAQKIVNVTFPAEYGVKELAGKPAAFEVSVTEIRQPVAVAVDDALAKSLGLDDLATLRKRIREQIEGEYQALARARLKRKLLDVLADNHEFVVPEGLVDTEFSAIWRQIEADMKADRLDAEDKGKSEEQLRNEYRDIARRRVKLGLLLSDVGQKNNIQVANEELTRALVAEARRYPGQEKQVIDYYQGSPEALNQLRAPLYEEKVIDFVLEQAQIAERKISAEALKAELEAEPASSR